uniref:Uncharacterized protein n=1 Tax=Arundo donax TaxID=35708 RepID=A0A0A9A8Z9_ARUDO
MQAMGVELDDARWPTVLQQCHISCACRRV